MSRNPEWAKPRSGGISYNELLKKESRHVPDILTEESAPYLGSDDIPTERYTSQAFHDLEMEKIWSRVWQMACREEDIPNAGDHIVYDIGDYSILVTRTEDDQIKAYHNACLHRGRQLCDQDGNKDYFRCPFHGFAWNLDGSLRDIPCKWDFPHIDRKKWDLPEVKVGTWRGWVFINLDDECESLESYLGEELYRQFARWPQDALYKTVHVAKIMECNWKVAQEAFMESFHVVATHPQLLESVGDSNTQYDTYGNFNRAITTNFLPSPHMDSEPSQQAIFDAMTDRQIGDPPMVEVPEGSTAREVAASGSREALRPFFGDLVDEMSDSEMVDYIYYSIFPNFHPKGRLEPQEIYRFRPYKNNPLRCIMEVIFLKPFKGERPAAAPIHWLREDEDWADAPEIGAGMIRVFNQDTLNFPQVQRGIQATRKKGLTLANYQESKIRHFHTLIERYTNQD